MGNKMNKTVFFVAILLASAMCSESSFDINQITDELVELNKHAGNSHGLMNLVSEVHEAYSNTGKAFHERYENLMQSAKAGKIAFKHGLKQLKEHIGHINDEIKKAKHESKEAAASLIKYQKDLANEKKGLVEAEKSQDELLKKEKVHFIEANEKLAVIKTIKDIVVDELLNAPNKAFVQLGENVHSKISVLQVMLQKAAVPEFAPLMVTLAELAASKNFADQEIIHKILKVLNNLAKSIRKFYKSQKKSVHETWEDLKKESEEKGHSIASLLNLVAQAKSQQIENKHIVEGLEADLKHLHREIKRVQLNGKDLSKLIHYEKTIASSFNRHSNSLVHSMQKVAGKASLLH